MRPPHAYIYTASKIDLDLAEELVSPFERAPPARPAAGSLAQPAAAASHGNRWLRGWQTCPLTDRVSLSGLARAGC